MQSEELITRQELAAIFPDGIPMPVMKMIFPEKSEALTVDDIRYILNAMKPCADLSTDAEPVAWRGVGSDGVSEVTERLGIAEQWEADGIDVKPLYGEPGKTAPAVAVKALQAAEEELSRIDCIPMVTETSDTYAQLELAKVYAAKGAHEARKALAALSAQVQDVAGDEEWQLVPKHPTGRMIGAVVSMVDDYAPHPFVLNLYRAMLAAAPAKQEGGTNE